MKNIKSKRKISSVLRWVLWVLLVQFILINISAAFYAYRLTHFYNDPSLLEYKPSRNIFEKTWKLFTGPRQGKSIVDAAPEFPVDTIKLITKSGLKIDAWYSRPDSNAKGTVILFHGITANKLTTMSEASELRFMGYNVMLVDFRGHGNSDGNTTTMGYRESEEVKLSYDWVKQKGENHIWLWGSSMGAVVVAKAMVDYSLQPCGVILEMPFSSMQEHLKARARVLGFPQQPFAFLVTGWIGIERSFNGYRHRTTRYVSQITCPVLLQWGTLDNYVLRPEIEKVYNAIASKQKKWVEYETAGHGSMLRSDPPKWRGVMADFLGSCK